MDRYNPITDFLVTARGKLRRRLQRLPRRRRRAAQLAFVSACVLALMVGMACLIGFLVRH